VTKSIQVASIGEEIVRGGVSYLNIFFSMNTLTRCMRAYSYAMFKSKGKHLLIADVDDKFK